MRMDSSRKRKNEKSRKAPILRIIKRAEARSSTVNLFCSLRILLKVSSRRRLWFCLQSGVAPVVCRP